MNVYDRAKNCEYTNVIVHIIKADKTFYFYRLPCYTER